MDELLQDRLDLEKQLLASWNSCADQLSKSQQQMVYDTLVSLLYDKHSNSLKTLSLKNAKIGSRVMAAPAFGKSRKARST